MRSSLVSQPVAFEVTGDWMVNQYRQYAPEAEYGITYLPTAQEGGQSVTWSGGWSLVVPNGAANPEGAADFMRFFCGEPGQRIYTAESSHLPTLTALTTDESLYNERTLFFASQLLPTSNSRPPLAVGSQYWDELTSAYEAICLNTAQPAEALGGVRERIQEALSDYC